jgi:hypothetical protein
VSAEVPKLQHRLSLAAPGACGDRPPAEAVVVLADPALLSLLTPLPSVPGGISLDDRAMAFKAWHRFEYV